MSLWIHQTFRPLLLPGGALLLGIAAMDHFRWITLPMTALIFLYWCGLLGGCLLAWRFHSSRIMSCLVVLLFAQQALALAGTGHLPFSAGEIVIVKALALLVPLNYLFIALTRELGVDLRSMAPVVLLLFAESVILFVLDRSAQPIPGIRSHPSHLQIVELPTWALAVFATSLLLLLLRFLSTRKPTDSALFWSLAAGLLFLRFTGSNQGPMLYLISAVYIPVVALIENSYLLAYHDELTSLPSRRAFNEALHRLRDPYSIAVVDIDHFKKFNDTYGHDTGDQVLRMVAAKLSQVTGGGQAFRCGGEEFMILFPGKTTEGALDHLERVRQVIESSQFRTRGDDRRQQPRGPERRKQGLNSAKTKGKKVQAIRAEDRRQPGELHRVTVSIGVATSSGTSPDPHLVLEAADKALYRAKEEGRNRVEAETAKRRTRRAGAGIA